MSKTAAILSAVENRADGLLAFAAELVTIPSLADQEAAAQERIATELRGLGMETEIFPCKHAEVAHHPAFSDDGFSADTRVNVVGRWPAVRPGGHSLILNGHVDVVPIGDRSTWSRDPFGGQVADGRLWGRGACDMKAGLAAAIFALRALRDVEFELAGDVSVHSVIGEETGGLGTLTNVVQGRTADGVIIVEPTDLRLTPVHAGALSFRLTVPGKAAHAANRKDGISAIEKFEVIHHALRTLEARRHERTSHPLFADPTAIAPISVGTVHAGDWPSSVPDELVAEGRMGVFPGETPDEAREQLEATVAAVAESDAFLRHRPPTVEWIEGQFEPGETPADHPLIEQLAACHLEALGAEPIFQGLTAGTDLRLYTIHGSTPGLLYGPGHIDQAHATDEFVAVDDIVAACKVLALTVASWTSP